MIAFIYKQLSDQANQYLTANLPEGIQAVFRTSLKPDECYPAFMQADFILGNPPRGWFNTLPPQLKCWHLASAGFSEYEGMVAPVPVVNMGDFFARPCAETIVGGVLAFCRGIHTLTKLQSAKDWQGEKVRTSLRLLGDQQAIVLGAGAIGLHVKEMLQGFGCTVRMTARTNPAADIHSLEELMAALPQTTLLINTLPGSAGKYVSADMLNALPPQAIYASVGRGETTDEEALITALNNGKLAGAVLDVTEEEPLPVNSPLWDMDNVILTQHTGGGKADELTGIARQFISNLHHFLKKEPLENPVELSRGY
ncbi:D-2-hydroxyacid dehydrogenase [Pseudoflavitalea sp. X16]|uniref:D-2-hydroxyacid dehydrogenase n=1 Tax=Paraflavitalea devenefica TaxID=2716334 RepID=UPI00142100E4|nr:D-2-hydroxyacid dehydrogenase [Paraflavitalea devenefica]NII27328.1 D-2-hydroxyacid dehydrogenase [Paraflavitalea devenefica]